jgi:hypothetical protein
MGRAHPFVVSFPSCLCADHKGMTEMPVGVMRLLAAGIPLSLLADLVVPPNSAEILAREARGSLPAA